MPRRWRNLDTAKAPPFVVKRRDAEGGPGGNVRARFLSSFLCRVTKKGHPKPAQRSAQLDKVEVGCMRVKRNSCLKFQQSPDSRYLALKQSIPFMLHQQNLLAFTPQKM